MFGTLGTQEILLIIGLAMLLFGASAIPKLARSLGKARGEFKRAQTEMEEELRKGEKEAEAKAQEEERRHKPPGVQPPPSAPKELAPSNPRP